MYTGPQIIKDGLVLHLDAANIKSYPGTGTTWFDRSGNNNHGQFVNTPSFNSNNMGSISFDGVDDTIDLGSPGSLLLSAITINIFVSFTSITPTSGAMAIIGRFGNSGTSFAHNYFFNLTSQRLNFGFNQSGTSNYPVTYLDFTPNLNQIYNFTITYSPALSKSIYTNGVLNTSYYFDSITNQIMALNTGTKLSIASDYIENTFYSNCKIYQTSIYNRVLSQTEVLHNFNATKSRYGL
jgi:hypothetical protein